MGEKKQSLRRKLIWTKILSERILPKFEKYQVQEKIQV